MPGLDEYLDAVDAGAEPAQEQEQVTEQETGVEESQEAAETTTVEEPAKAVKSPEEGLQAALLAERRKRQELEQQLAESKKKKPDFWEDPEARLADTENRFQQQLVMQKLDISEAFAREKYSDFDEKLEVFAAMTQENPALYQQMIQQVNPADFAYKAATNQQKLKEMGNPLEYEAKLEARLRAKWEAERAEENKKRADLPGSIATTAGVGGSTAATWSGPTTLDDLLK